MEKCQSNRWAACGLLVARQSLSPSSTGEQEHFIEPELFASSVFQFKLPLGAVAQRLHCASITAQRQIFFVLLKRASTGLLKVGQYPLPQHLRLPPAFRVVLQFRSPHPAGHLCRSHRSALRMVLFDRIELAAQPAALSVGGEQKVALLIFTNTPDAPHGLERKVKFHLKPPGD